MNIGCDDMDNEKIIKLQHFFSVDTKIKKEIYDIAPQSLNGYIDETSISEYTDKLNDSLIYILSELKCVALDVFGKESSIFNKVCYLEQDIKTNFYSCGFDIEKLKSFYQKYISNMEPSFIDDVKRSYIGYYFGGGGVSPLKKASTINEILHLMHSRIINNEGLLQSIPLLNEKRTEERAGPRTGKSPHAPYAAQLRPAGDRFRGHPPGLRPDGRRRQRLARRIQLRDVLVEAHHAGPDPRDRRFRHRDLCDHATLQVIPGPLRNAVPAGRPARQRPADRNSRQLKTLSKK